MNPLAATAGIGVATYGAMRILPSALGAKVYGAEWYRLVVLELRQRTGQHLAATCREVYEKQLAQAMKARGPCLTEPAFPKGYTVRELRELATLWIQSGHEGLGLEGLLGVQGGAEAAGEALDVLDDRRDELNQSGGFLDQVVAPDAKIAGIWRAISWFATSCDNSRNVELELETSRDIFDYAGDAIRWPFETAAGVAGDAIGAVLGPLAKAALVVGAGFLLVLVVTR